LRFVRRANHEAGAIVIRQRLRARWFANRGPGASVRESVTATRRADGERAMRNFGEIFPPGRFSPRKGEDVRPKQGID
jgi:hypothetical protein